MSNPFHPLDHYIDNPPENYLNQTQYFYGLNGSNIMYVAEALGSHIFHQNHQLGKPFANNTSDEVIIDTITDTITDYSGNLNVLLVNDASGNITLDTHRQYLIIYYDGYKYSTTVDDTSSISYHSTSSTHSDASGNFSATIYDSKVGKLEINCPAFVYSGDDTNISGHSVTIPLPLDGVVVTRSYGQGIANADPICYIHDPIYPSPLSAFEPE